MSGRAILLAGCVMLLCTGATFAADAGGTNERAKAILFDDAGRTPAASAGRAPLASAKPVEPSPTFIRSDEALPLQIPTETPWPGYSEVFEFDAAENIDATGYAGQAIADVRGNYCGDPIAGNCCDTNWTPYCDDAACCDYVCSELGMWWCCDYYGWGYGCAAAAREFCTCSAPTGACCIEDAGTCMDLTYFDCLSLDGRWYPNSDCGDSWFECPGCAQEEALYSQPVGSAYPVMHAITSDLEIQTKGIADRFENVQGDICGLKWYGKTDGRYPWEACTNNPEDFQITFYEDGGGQPGAVACEYTVTVTGRLLDTYAATGLTMYEYVAEFDTCCTLESGYVTINGISMDPPACYFWMYASYEGDLSICAWSSDLNQWLCLEPGSAGAHDLAFCLLGTPYPGACCDEADGTCQVVEAVDCPPTSRFTPGVTCENLDPPCGTLTGACCIDEPPYCYIDSEVNCVGTYLGHGTICDTNDCNANGVPDTCDIGSGNSADCDGNGVPDECDIAGGADDYDLNGVPDACEPDCNNNGLVDACDIGCGTGNCAGHPTVTCGQGTDCQPNGVLDECELGTAGSALLWDNGAPRDVSPASVWSQFGGYHYDRFVVDDFSLSSASTINNVSWHVEEDEAYVWTGRVRIDIYPDNGAGGPNDFEPYMSMWVPTDGGTVVRTPLGAGVDLAYRYRIDVYGLDIPLGPGTWWIGLATGGEPLAPPTDGTAVGLSKWCASRMQEVIETGIIVLGEAHVRTPSRDYPVFEPVSIRHVQDDYLQAAYDMSFTIATTAHGADCDGNGTPDDCDIANCGGDAWCQDCNGNGIPDGCEPDCNGNGVADSCDIRDCDGSAWCDDCDFNEIPDVCQISPLGTDPDCNANGVPDHCDVANGVDCNDNGIPDECDVASGTSTDHDGNGVPDECDPDCNENGIPDACDVDCTTGTCNQVVGCGTSADCQSDGIPDECQLNLPTTYALDRGVQTYGIGAPAAASIAWLNPFTVQDGYDTITDISLAWGDVPNDLPATVYLWSDPDGDGDPSDAQILASAATAVADANTNVFITVDIPDTYVGPVGTRFFVGAIMDAPEGTYPAAFDETGPYPETSSWIVGNTMAPMDPNNLSAGDLSLTSFYFGWWLVRADAVLIMDCNGNSVPDECDIASGFSTDCNGNGKPDECEWVDCNDNGEHDACDLVNCDGSPWCSDCNGNGLIDECDLASGASSDCQPDGIPDECQPDCNENAIPDDCDLRDCDGSVWCSDCNNDGVLDACQLGDGAYVYKYDDGSANTVVGYGPDPSDIVWIQRFTVSPGFETIGAIATMFGAPGEYSGLDAGDEVSVYIWEDSMLGMFQMATLVSSTTTAVDAASNMTGVMQTIPIDPVTIGTQQFFVGVHVTAAGFGVPAPGDQTEPLANESWIAFCSPGAFDAGNLMMIPGLQLIDMTSQWTPVDWLLRAMTPAEIPSNDCNQNGIPDDCELCGDLDSDGDVDYDDYVIFLEAFGGVTDGIPAVDYCCDYDGSGAVGMADFDAWLGCYRAYVNDPLAGPPTIGKRRIRVPLSPLPKQGLRPAP